MSALRRRDDRTESQAARRPTGEPSDDGGERASLTDSAPFRLGRLLFGGVLAFMALDNLRNLEDQIEYAEANGAPLPDLSVPAVSSSLFVGSVGLAVWRAPVTAASMVAAFFVAITPVMHDFWAVDDPETRQSQQIHFLKNAALLGATLTFLAAGLRAE